MADNIALLECYQTNTRYFIVTELTFAGNLCTQVTMLNLTTREATLIPYAVVMEQITAGALWRWHAPLSIYNPKLTKHAA